jgi:hypothetical protein
MRVGGAIAERPIPYTQIPTTFRTFAGWVHRPGPESRVVG